MASTTWVVRGTEPTFIFATSSLISDRPALRRSGSTAFDQVLLVGRQIETGIIPEYLALIFVFGRGHGRPREPDCGNPERTSPRHLISARGARLQWRELLFVSVQRLRRLAG